MVSHLSSNTDSWHFSQLGISVVTTTHYSIRCVTLGIKKHPYTLISLIYVCLYVHVCACHFFFKALVAQFVLELIVAEDGFELDLQSFLAFRGN